ncbi:MAG: prolyl oligopeptidase family serine peptidase [Fimbriimonadales bacterium]|nr:prolyl oligopeptidase family serine peptidase [Fimbriimonadales bacterium]
MRTLLTLAMVFAAYLAGFWNFGTPEQSSKYPVVEWTMDGQKRQAIVIPPSSGTKQGAPVVFVFHGGGGSMYRMADLGFQQHWKEAFIVCPQALPAPTLRSPEGNLPAWQFRSGTTNNRDLKFFDAMLKTLREQHNIDEKRVYATGHSNGGFFTYVLWAERGDKLAGIAPSACHANAIRARQSNLRPIPLMHIAGEQDNVIPFKNQRQSMDALKKFLQCEPEGKLWAKAGSLTATLYPSKKGIPFVEVLHPGDHKYPSEAPALIVRFFKELAGGAPTPPAPVRAPN